MTTEVALRELGSLYDGGRSRMSEIVSSLPDAKAVPIPACPPWTAHDLVSHLTGNCADVIRGNLEGLATEAWTKAQVEERKDRSTDSVLDEWAQIGPMFAGVIDDFPGKYGIMTVGDITVHEFDLRSSLSDKGGRDSAAVDVATNFVVTTIVQSACRAFGVGPLEIRAGDRRWVVGTGDAATNDPEEWRAAMMTEEAPPSAGEPVATVSGDPFEMFRSLTGRRSADQIRALQWSGDVDTFLPVFGFGPFALRSTDLVD